MKSIILSVLALAAISSCSSPDYGKKVAVEGTKGEVLYKGDGVTEADAKKLGEFLKSANYFSTEKRQSVQLMKSAGDAYEIRFAVDQKKVNERPDAVTEFGKLGAALSIEQFNNKPVNIFLCDANFKDFMSIPFDQEMVKKIMQPGDPNEETTNPADSTGNTNPADSTDHSNQ
jgi:hypothetical protein